MKSGNSPIQRDKDVIAALQAAWDRSVGMDVVSRAGVVRGIAKLTTNKETSTTLLTFADNLLSLDEQSRDFIITF